jgi:hypothetical protein
MIRVQSIIVGYIAKPHSLPFHLWNGKEAIWCSLPFHLWKGIYGTVRNLKGFSPPLSIWPLHLLEIKKGLMIRVQSIIIGHVAKPHSLPFHLWNGKEAMRYSLPFHLWNGIYGTVRNLKGFSTPFIDLSITSTGN